MSSLGARIRQAADRVGGIEKLASQLEAIGLRTLSGYVNGRANLDLHVQLGREKPQFSGHAPVGVCRNILKPTVKRPRRSITRKSLRLLIFPPVPAF